jgi:peptide/nickel transport system permease protein
VLLQGLFARIGLAWLPPTGLQGPDARDLPLFEYVIDGVRHLVLPVVSLSYGSLALLSRQTRAAVLENLSADHVRTARAKGMPEGAVFLRHVVRNSLLPQITVLAAVLPTMLSGSIVVERVFNLPGMGTLLLESIDSRDREVLMACVLIVSVVNVTALLAADLLYAAADPRAEA